MSKGAEAFIAREASLVVDAKQISSDLELAKEDHTAYVARSECDISHLRQQFELTKSEQDAASKDLDNVKNEVTSLHIQLQNSDTILAIAESSLSGVIARKDILIVDLCKGKRKFLISSEVFILSGLWTFQRL